MQNDDISQITEDQLIEIYRGLAKAGFLGYRIITLHLAAHDVESPRLLLRKVRVRQPQKPWLRGHSPSMTGPTQWLTMDKE